MFVIYRGNAGLIMTDYNGKRYCFTKGIPVDVPKEVYDYIIDTGAIEAKELDVLQEAPAPKLEEKKKETPAPQESDSSSNKEVPAPKKDKEIRKNDTKKRGKKR